MKGKKRLHLGRVVYELDEMTGITGEFFFFFLDYSTTLRNESTPEKAPAIWK